MEFAPGIQTRPRPPKRSKPKPKKSSSIYLPRPVWRILPLHQCLGFALWIDLLQGDSFYEKEISLREDIEKHSSPSQTAWNMNNEFVETQRLDYLNKAHQVMGLLYKNQKIRWIMKRFLSKYRISKFQKVNEEDPITLEAFKQPIYVVSWIQRKIYTFEASTLARHIHKQLLHNIGHIAQPISPKNPLTNEIFSFAQLLSFLDQCRLYGKTFWTIEAFIQSRYDMATFTLTHSKALRLNALKVTMSNVEDWDCIDTLYDFIKSQHHYHQRSFYINTYKWAVNHAQREGIMMKWNKLCVKWYEIDILIDDYDTKRRFFDDIYRKTEVLCASAKDIYELRKSSTLVDGSRSLQHIQREG